MRAGEVLSIAIACTATFGKPLTAVAHAVPPLLLLTSEPGGSTPGGGTAMIVPAYTLADEVGSTAIEAMRSEELEKTGDQLVPPFVVRNSVPNEPAKRTCGFERSMASAAMLRLLNPELTDVHVP